jgi:hypothetical protein
MEYKEDEEYNFTQTQLIGNTQPWPWYGIPSGVYLVNPGMSIWVFTALAKVFGIHRPTDLATAVQLFAIFGMTLILPLAFKFVSSRERGTWLWAFALAMVNPFLVFYQRKLWPEPFLPFFTMLMLIGWWSRTRRFGAFTWGLIGAWVGQVHMSGFFLAFALFLWTLFFDRFEKLRLQVVEWRYWFLGSVLGALPLIPWVIYIFQHPIQQSMSAGWNEMIQFKYWAFWFTDPTGLHLGNPLGLLRGQSNFTQISDFIRYPIIQGHATYLTGVAHGVAAISVAYIFARGLRNLFQVGPLTQGRRWFDVWVGRESQTAFVQNAALWGCGILMTITGVVIRRYYMAVTFPLEFICLIRMAKPETTWGRRSLIALWMAELVISANFVGYIHVNQGSLQGDYGAAYRVIKNCKTGGECSECAPATP